MRPNHFFLRILILVLCLGIASLLGAISPDDFNKITFINNLASEKNIEYLFFSPGDSQFWGPDVLEKNNAIAKGKKQTAYVFYPDTNAVFDFMAVDSDGMIYEINNVQIQDGKEKIVSITDRQITKRNLSSLPMAEVIVVNNTKRNIDFAFFAPADSKIWGLEILNSSRSLKEDEEVSFLVLLAGEHFDMELMALGENGKEYQRTISIGTSLETINSSLDTRNLSK